LLSSILQWQWTTEVFEDFEIDDATDRQAQQALDHDTAGNMTYDGQ